MAKREVDPLTGVETTGHEWDGIKELNNPMPQWWIWTFLACILFSIVYVWFMPSWPTTYSYDEGALKWNSRLVLEQRMSEAREAQSGWIRQIEETPLEEISSQPDLFAFAVTGGRVAYNTNCAGCHGVGGGGQVGIFPSLANDDWIWGGAIDEIMETIRVGVRGDHSETRFSMMPAFGADGILDDAQIDAVADYVLSLSDARVSPSEEGAQLFAENCASCHGGDGGGERDFGAPTLNNFIWLFGGSKEDIVAQIANPRHGVMPPWEGRLEPATLRMLAVYVHSLGGGE